MIVFLADGMVLESGSPAELVSRDGPFLRLVKETGTENAQVLIDLAMRRKFETEEDFEEQVNYVRRQSLLPVVMEQSEE